MNSAIWFVYCIYIYYDMAMVNHNKTSADIASISLFTMAALMFVGGIMIGKRPGRIYYPVLILVTLNTLFALMNPSNVLYLTAFVINVVILSILLSLRKEYLSTP